MKVDALPFVCIVNPPRHGKSLFLDRIFFDRDDFRVVEMTYNNNSNVTLSELESPRQALFFFWLRFIGSVCGETFSMVKKHSHTYFGYNERTEYSLEWAKNILLRVYNRNPFVDAVSKEQLHLVIAVDEFSKLTDLTLKWSQDDRDAFIRALNNEKQFHPVVQFVFTGFNKEMTTLIEASGAKVLCKTLTLCDFSSAKPLLKRIVDAYDSTEKVPLLLFETIKSTPGLVGLWAERVFSLHCRDSSIVSFKESLPWIQHVCAETKYSGATTSPLEDNWSLIVDYLKISENQEFESSENQLFEVTTLGNKLISNLIGVLQRVDGHEIKQPLISPLCFVCIAFSSLVPKCKLEKDLKEHIKSALRFCEKRPPIQEKNDGTAFENFVLEALTTRIITRMIAEKSNPDDGLASFCFRSLFPSDVSRVVSASSPRMPGQTDSVVSKVDDPERMSSSTGSSYCIHGISSKASLAKMLSSPLYYLFPLGLEELDRIANGEVRIISSLVEGTSSHHGQFDFPITVNANRCKTPIHVVSKAADSINLSPEEQIALTSRIALPTELRNEVQTIWRSMESSIKTIMQNYMTCSIFPVVKDATGCDLVLLCRDGTNPKAYHFVALEVKDSRNTSSQDWQEKLFKLTSCRCIIPRLKAAMEKEGIVLTYHIVFAGREEWKESSEVAAADARCVDFKY